MKSKISEVKNNYSEEQYRIMRTSFLTAFPKIFTDIEFSTDIFSIMKDLALKKGFSFLPNHFSNEMSVEIEARHKALNCALSKYITEDTLVIEIAAGLSPRHLQYRNYDYVELDFKPVIDIKKEIYTSMGYSTLNNTLYDVDITDIDSFHECLTKIINYKKYKKIIILNEGLFWYLTKNDIQNFTTELMSTLDNISWMWITSDCPATIKNDSDYRSIISNSAKVRKDTFTDYEDFSTFFNNIGLENIRYKLSDFLNYENLSSAKFLSFNEYETNKKIDSYTDIAILQI